MGKSKKKTRDFQKVKLKVGKKLKKPNETETGFKARKVVILEQLKQQSLSDQVVSKKKLTLQELWQHTRHHNSNVRKDAVTGLKEIISQQNQSQIKADLKVYVESLAPLMSDEEPDVRKLTLSTLRMVLEKVQSVDVSPLFHLIVAHVTCASTQLNQQIKLFSVKFVELLLDCLPDLCKGNWSLLKSYVDLLNFKEKSADMKRKSTLLFGLSRILDLNYRQIVGKNVSNGGNCDSPIVNPKSLSLIPRNLAPFDFPVLSNAFFAIGMCDEMKNVKNLNYLLDRVIPFCHSLWTEITTSDNDGVSESGNLFDLETLKIMMTILKIYVVMIERVNDAEDLLDVGGENGTKLKTNFTQYFEKDAFVRRYWDVFPCQSKRAKAVDAFSSSDICATVNLLICELCASVLAKMVDVDRIDTFLRRLLRKDKNLDSKKVEYVRRVANVYHINLEFFDQLD